MGELSLIACQTNCKKCHLSFPDVQVGDRTGISHHYVLTVLVHMKHVIARVALLCCVGIIW